MSRTFTANVILRDRNQELHTFLVGEEVPEWAENLGDHVYTNSKPGGGAVQTAASDDTSDDTVTPDETPADAADASDDDLPPYDEWSKADLQSEAKGRQLDGFRTDLNKSELVALLEADDEAGE